MTNIVREIGGGLAGAEAAYQLARRGVAVELFEMRPVRATEAHATGDFGELVCSNSLRSNLLTAPAGLLKEEMRRRVRVGSGPWRLLARAKYGSGGAADGRRHSPGSDRDSFRRRDSRHRATHFSGIVISA